VRRDQNERYYDLIKVFAAKTGVPAVLNTSFNLKGEPIVNSPFDAIRTFYTSGLDALILDRYLIAKISPDNSTSNAERAKVTAGAEA
jgi:carbamoyltransferase